MKHSRIEVTIRQIPPHLLMIGVPRAINGASTRSITSLAHRLSMVVRTQDQSFTTNPSSKLEVYYYSITRRQQPFEEHYKRARWEEIYYINDRVESAIVYIVQYSIWYIQIRLNESSFETRVYNGSTPKPLGRKLRPLVLTTMDITTINSHCLMKGSDCSSKIAPCFNSKLPGISKRMPSHPTTKTPSHNIFEP
jgi:hypothetical protein